MNELHSLVALTTFPYIGPLKIRLLIKYFGSAKQALEAKKEDLMPLPGFGPKIIENWTLTQERKPWWKEIELADALQIKLIPWTHPSYPKRLLDIIDSPVLLYVRGEIQLQDHQAIAIVGTRHPTNYGIENAERFGRHLAEVGYTIISGLARGIDTAAHRSALSAGRTIAVIGSGLADIYPRENYRLAEAISQNGAVISEFPMTTPPDRQNFPQRNRIVSGMSLGVLLVEAPYQSGAMITMEKALLQKRRLFTIPGPLGPEFQGNHSLIKNEKAQLVENVEDIVTHFQSLFPSHCTTRISLPTLNLEKEEIEFLNKLPSQELSLEEISQKVHLPVAKLNVLIMSLVLKRAVKEYPGKIYKKVSYQNG